MREGVCGGDGEEGEEGGKRRVGAGMMCGKELTTREAKSG